MMSLFWSFYEKELQKTSQEKFRIKKVFEKVKKKEKVMTCTSNGEDMKIHLIVGLMKKTIYKNESILS